MAERVLKIKTVSEVAEAISGLTDLSGSLKGVGTAALEASGKAKSGWKALEAQWKSSTEAAKGVADQAIKVESALNAMGRAGSASKLESSLVAAKVEFTRLQEKIREVAAAGGTIDDGVVASMNVMRASIDAGKAKLDDLRSSAERAKRELGLVGKAGGEAAAGVRQAGAAAGEASGKMGQIGESLKKQTEGFNKMRGAALEAWGALSLGQQIGGALADAIDKWDARRAIADKAAADAAQEAILLEAAMRAVSKGFIEAGSSASETVSRYVRMTTEMGRLDEASRRYIQTVAGMKAPELWGEVEKRAQAMASTLTGAYKRSEEEGNRWALANAAAIKGILVEFDRVGKEAPEALREYLAKAEEWAKMNEKVAASARAVGEATASAASGVEKLKTALEAMGSAGTADTIKAIAEALETIRAEGGSTGDAFAANVDAMAKLREEAKGSYETLDAFRKQILDQIPAYQASALVNQDYVGALDEVTAAYERIEQARRAANEADIEALANMQRMKDEARSMTTSIDTIGEAWFRATGQVAGFTVEVRTATKAVEETNPSFDAMIEELAKVSDEYGRMIPWFGALIAKLEKGAISVEEFLVQLDAMNRGFLQIQGMSGNMFGDIGSEVARLTKIINDFVGGERRQSRDNTTRDWRKKR